jgi:hypothetical protein
MVIVMLSMVSIGHTPDVVCNIVSMDKTAIHVPSAVVWSDYFDDEDISDWQLFKVNHTANPDTLLPGNTSAVGGVMRHHDTEWSYAGHNSSIAFGTWNFSIDIQWPIDEHHYSVAFISEIFDDDWLTNQSVGSVCAVVFYLYETGITELRIARGDHDIGVLWMDDYAANGIMGWHNIIITRELSGQFYVYLDGSLILEAKDLHQTTSERFYFLSHGGPAIDNVSVSDSIDYDAAGPEFEPSVPNQIAVAGEPYSYDVNASDFSGIDEWWISDTANFTIDNDGIITNIEDLVEGEYILSVFVNDTLGNTAGDVFGITVNPAATTTSTSATTTSPTTTEVAPPPIPIELMLAGIGGAVVVILVLVILRIRK